MTAMDAGEAFITIVERLEDAVKERTQAQETIARVRAIVRPVTLPVEGRNAVEIAMANIMREVGA